MSLDETRSLCGSDLHVRTAQTAILPCEEHLRNLQRRMRNRAGLDSLARLRALSVRRFRARDNDDCNRDEASER